MPSRLEGLDSLRGCIILVKNSFWSNNGLFIFGLVLFPNQLYGSHQLIPSMIWLLVLTPIIHRSVNVFGYKIGLKSVPY